MSCGRPASGGKAVAIGQPSSSFSVRSPLNCQSYVDDDGRLAKATMDWSEEAAPEVTLKRRRASSISPQSIRCCSGTRRSSHPIRDAIWSLPIDSHSPADLVWRRRIAVNSPPGLLVVHSSRSLRWGKAGNLARGDRVLISSGGSRRRTANRLGWKGVFSMFLWGAASHPFS